ncbi:polysaccharide pyruvyl transferase family protein [Glutamicibacter ardleyensis]|uniref:polysaccharide pyruvyl transferase family protein n=1 Tax=Glutamicibacter ardleyensis TaxID=225894 RepID=UPI003FD60EA8
MTNNTVSSFIVLTGAYGNIGDALIRRRVLHWIDTDSDIHAYVGTADPNWIEQLNFRSEKTSIYQRREFTSWLLKAIFGSGPRVLILDPGEVDLGRAALKSELVIGLLTVLLRLRGGSVIRPPRSLVVRSRTLLKLHKLVSKASTLSFWRENASYAQVRTGFSVPDVAFQEYDEVIADSGKRKKIFVSMRATRPDLPLVVLNEIRQFAATNDLDLIVGSQVKADEPRTKELAQTLNADYLAWGDSTDSEQEHRLRAIYSESCLVITDRLHVAILASCLGAVPTEIAVEPNGKIQRHFLQIGVEGISFNALEYEDMDVLRFLQKNIGRKIDINSAVKNAQLKVCEVEEKISKVFDRLNNI